MKTDWERIQEAIIARATNLILQDMASQFDRGEWPEPHPQAAVTQAMKEVEELLRSEKEKDHARDH